jgi:hypothetical protein
MQTLHYLVLASSLILGCTRADSPVATQEPEVDTDKDADSHTPDTEQPLDTSPMVDTSVGPCEDWPEAVVLGRLVPWNFREHANPDWDALEEGELLNASVNFGSTYVELFPLLRNIEPHGMTQAEVWITHPTTGEELGWKMKGSLLPTYEHGKCGLYKNIGAIKLTDKITRPDAVRIRIVVSHDGKKYTDEVVGGIPF